MTNTTNLTSIPIYDDITLCLTIGKRPDDLRQTLNSLLSKAQFKHIIAINDFADEETNLVFKECCPDGKLICLGHNIGHHAAIDLMYSKITTPFVFHCEDDWLFDSLINLHDITFFLQQHPNITMICLRQLSDMNFSNQDIQQFIEQDSPFGKLVDVKSVHAQWYGYSFNPHIATIKTWQQLQPFAQFKKERHVSRTFRKTQQHVLFLKHGCCHHIGFNSLANPPKKTLWQKIKGKIFG